MRNIQLIDNDNHTQKETMKKKLDRTIHLAD